MVYDNAVGFGFCVLIVVMLFLLFCFRCSKRTKKTQKTSKKQGDPVNLSSDVINNYFFNSPQTPERLKLLNKILKCQGWVIYVGNEKDKDYVLNVLTKIGEKKISGVETPPIKTYDPSNPPSGMLPEHLPSAYNQLLPSNMNIGRIMDYDEVWKVAYIGIQDSQRLPVNQQLRDKCNYLIANDLK